MSYIRAIVIILFALFVVVLAVQNHEAMSTPVQFQMDLLFFDFESSPMSFYTVAVITFLLGVLITGLYGVTERFRLKREIKMLRKQAREKDKELNSLRNLPVTSEDMGSQKTSNAQ